MVWTLPKNINLSIKIWSEDALAFVEGPADTHHIDLPAAYILSVLSEKETAELEDLQLKLNSHSDGEFDHAQARDILSRLQRMRLVEQIANGSASE